MNEVIEYRGYQIKISNDVPEESPRDWEDNIGRMICFHRKYDLGDNGLEMTKEELIDIVKNTKEYVSLPLYLYDHSGITMNTTGFSCQWDSGQVGYIYANKKEVCKKMGWEILTKKRKEELYKILRNEVKLYDDFITGQVYGYDIFNGEEDIPESSGGYFGSDHKESGLIDDAKAVVDSCIKYEEKKKIEEEKNCGVQTELELV